MPFDWTAFGEGALGGVKEGFLTATELRKLIAETKLREAEQVFNLLQTQYQKERLDLDKTIAQYEIFARERARLHPEELRGSEFMQHVIGKHIAEEGKYPEKEVLMKYDIPEAKYASAKTKVDLISRIGKVQDRVQWLLSTDNPDILKWDAETYQPVVNAGVLMNQASTYPACEEIYRKVIAEMKQQKPEGMTQQIFTSWLNMAEKVLTDVLKKKKEEFDLRYQLNIAAEADYQIEDLLRRLGGNIQVTE